MGVRSWVSARCWSIWRSFWAEADKWLARSLLGAVAVAVSVAFLWWRTRLSDRLSVPLWLVLVLGGVLATSLLVNAYAAWTAWKERRRPGEGRSWAEITVPRLGLIFRVRKRLLGGDRLDEGWESRYEYSISNPLCADSSCRNELVYRKYNTNYLSGECGRCGKRIVEHGEEGSGPSRSVDVEISKLKVWLFNELRRVHRTGAEVKDGLRLKMRNQPRA